MKIYMCTSCGFRHEYELRESCPRECPECNAVSCRIIYPRVRTRLRKPKGEKCGVDALHVENERWSEAMGCNPDQIPEFKKKWPWMEFDKEGRCRVGSRHEKLRIMKARGFTERG